MTNTGAPHSSFSGPGGYSPYRVLVMLLLLIMIFLLLGTLFTFVLAQWYGLDLTVLMSEAEQIDSLKKRNFVRLSLLINHLTLFVGPSILLGVLLYKDRFFPSLQLKNEIRFWNVFLAIMILFFAFPLVQYSYWLNQQLPLPEWMMSMEDNANSVMTNLLVADSTFELLFNIVVIALIPSIGEELVFRGYLQQNLARIFKNPIAAIWASAIIFSAIHFQFQGFFPRMILGAVLGYLFYWTGNLWIPVIAHFFNNAVQLVAQHLFVKDLSALDLDNLDKMPLTGVLISLAMVFTFSYILRLQNHQKAPDNHTSL